MKRGVGDGDITPETHVLLFDQIILLVNAIFDLVEDDGATGRLSFDLPEVTVTRILLGGIDDDGLERS